MIAALAAAMLAPPAAAEPEGDTIIVRAVRRRCRMEVANRILSDREFRARAAEWAEGRPVRVHAPEASGYKCLARIAFRLSERGVRLIHFVDPPGEE